MQSSLFPNGLITRLPGRFAKCGVLSPTLEIGFSRWRGKGVGGLRKLSSHCLLPDTKLLVIFGENLILLVYSGQRPFLVRYWLASLLHLTIVVILVS